MPRARTRARPTGGIAALAAALLGMALVGCSRSHHASAGAPSDTTSSTTTTAPAGPAVVDRGAAPRHLLRFALVTGTTRTVTVTTDLAVDQRVPAGDRLVDPPPIRQTIRFVVGAVDRRGAAVSFRVTAAVVDPTGTAVSAADALQIDHDLQALIGVSGQGHLSVQGWFTGVHLRLPSSLDATVRAQAGELSAQVATLTPRLPDVAVGAGASWTADDTTTVNGVQVRQRVTYVVTAIEGTIISFRSTTVATSGRQELTRAGLPTGTTATLVSGRLTGTGSGRLDLAAPVGTFHSTLAGTQAVAIVNRKMAPATVTQRVRESIDVVAAA